MICNDPYLGKAGEKQVAPARRRRKALARKETASSVPEETLPEPDPAPFDGAAETPHRPDTAPAEVGSLPGDMYSTPQPEAVHRTRSHRGEKRKPQQDDQEAAKLQQPSGPPPGNVDRTTEPEDATAASSKISGDGPSPPEREIIDLTIKEESLPTTPIPHAQAPGSNEDPPGLRAGWVRFRSSLSLIFSDEKLGLIPTFEHYIMFHGHQKIIFDHRRGD
jgi:hypothetical protein